MYHMVFILFNPAKLNKDVMAVEFNMAQFKLVISDTNGKSIAQELKDRAANPLLGSKIGDIIDSSIIGLQGVR